MSRLPLIGITCWVFLIVTVIVALADDETDDTRQKRQLGGVLGLLNGVLGYGYAYPGYGYGRYPYYGNPYYHYGGYRPAYRPYDHHYGPGWVGYGYW